MIALRTVCGVAALAFGIAAGFVLLGGPSFPSSFHSDPAGKAYALAASGHPGDAVAVYSEQIIRSPKDYVIYLRRGLTLQGLGRNDEALADFTEALRLSPPVMTADELGDRVNNLALPETHRLTLARQLHNQRAEILRLLGRPNDALADLDAAVALNVRDNETRAQRAVVRTFAGRIGDAVDDFNVILARGPNVNAMIGRANAKYLGGDYAGAAEDFGKVLETAPSKDIYAVWLLKSQLRGHLAIPLKEFEALPKSSPAWVGIDALLADHTPAQMAANLAAGMAKDKSLACDGMVFLGEWLVIKAEGQNAPAIFQDALDLCRPGTMPHAVATLELRRLAQVAATPAAPTETPTVPAILRTTPAANLTPGI